MNYIKTTLLLGVLIAGVSLVSADTGDNFLSGDTAVIDMPTETQVVTIGEDTFPEDAKPLSIKEQIKLNTQSIPELDEEQGVGEIETSTPPSFLVVDEVEPMPEIIEKNEIPVVEEVITAPIIETDLVTIEDTIEKEEESEVIPAPKTMVPLVLEPVELEEEREEELCEDDDPIQEPGTECDDENNYTTGDVILEDGCACEGEVPPITVLDDVSPIVYSESGVPLVQSVASIDVVGGGAPWCSMIARLNLKQFYPNRNYITGIAGPGTIAMGDAVTLIEDGIASGVLTNVAARDMQSSLESTDEIAHDFFIYTPRGYSIDTSKWYLQGHRAVAFLADDEQWYVLDPLRGSANTLPQLLREYVYHYSNKNGEFYMYTSSITDDQPKEFFQGEFSMDASCEIDFYTTPQTTNGLVYQSNQVCFDLVDLCKLPPKE